MEQRTATNKDKWICLSICCHTQQNLCEFVAFCVCCFYKIIKLIKDEQEKTSDTWLQGSTTLRTTFTSKRLYGLSKLTLISLCRKLIWMGTGWLRANKMGLNPLKTIVCFNQYEKSISSNSFTSLRGIDRILFSFFRRATIHDCGFHIDAILLEIQNHLSL